MFEFEDLKSANRVISDALAGFLAGMASGYNDDNARISIDALFTDEEMRNTLQLGCSCDERFSALSQAAYLIDLVEYASKNVGRATPGLQGEYYSDEKFEKSVLKRIDHSVNFDWQGGAPHSSLPKDNFSVRWTGILKPEADGDYTFIVESDDGIRLWISEEPITGDTHPIVENWTVHAPSRDTSAAIKLYKGASYNLKLEYFERTGGATVKLKWKNGSGSESIIAPRYLYYNRRYSETEFLQIFFQNIEKMSFAVGRIDKKEHQVRICIEVLKNYLDYKSLPAKGSQAEKNLIKAQKDYLLDAYQRMLILLGTNYSEIRLAQSADVGTRAEIADRIGIDDEVVETGPFKGKNKIDCLFLNPELSAKQDRALCEDNLEVLFGLPVTGSMKTPSNKVSMIEEWKSEHLRKLWLREDDSSSLPLIDPDLIGPGDIKIPEPQNIVYTIWETRKDWISRRLNDYKSIYSTAPSKGTLTSIREMLAANSLALSIDQLEDIDRMKAEGHNVRSMLEQLLLDYAEFKYILSLIKLAEKGQSLLEREWMDLSSILLQIDKKMKFEEFRKVEKAEGIILSQDYFTFPVPGENGEEEYREFSHWRSTRKQLLDWQQRLSNRIAQEEAASNAISEMIASVEDVCLPKLRDALIMASNLPGNLDDRAEEFSRIYQIDARTSGNLWTTRIDQATESVKSFLLGIRIGQVQEFYPGIFIDNPGFEEDWNLIGCYENWRAARYVYLYPENMLLPSLRKHTSSRFEQLYGTISSNGLISQSDAVYLQNLYLQYLEKISGLSYECRIDIDDSFFHFAVSKSGEIFISVFGKDDRNQPDVGKPLVLWQPLGVSNVEYIAGLAYSYSNVHIFTVPKDLIKPVVNFIALNSKDLTEFMSDRNALNGKYAMREIPIPYEETDQVKMSVEIVNDKPMTLSVNVSSYFYNIVFSGADTWSVVQQQEKYEKKWVELLRTSDIPGSIFNTVRQCIGVSYAKWQNEDYMFVFSSEYQGPIDVYDNPSPQNIAWCNVFKLSDMSHFASIPLKYELDSSFVIEHDEAQTYTSYDFKTINSFAVSVYNADRRRDPQLIILYNVNAEVTGYENVNIMMAMAYEFRGYTDNTKTLDCIAGQELLYTSYKIDYFRIAAGDFDYCGKLEVLLFILSNAGNNRTVSHDIIKMNFNPGNPPDNFGCDSFTENYSFLCSLESNMGFNVSISTYDYGKKAYNVSLTGYTELNPNSLSKAAVKLFNYSIISNSFSPCYDENLTFNVKTNGSGICIVNDYINNDDAVFLLSFTSDGNHDTGLLVYVYKSVRTVDMPTDQTHTGPLYSPYIPFVSMPFFEKRTEYNAIDSSSLQEFLKETVSNPQNKGANRIYIDEAFFFMPFVLASQLHKSGEFSNALSWFRKIYDYSRAPGDRKIYYGLVLEEAGTASQNADTVIVSDEWWNDPIDPHTLVSSRRNAYSRFVAWTISKCLIDYADAQFTSDTPDSVITARTLYQTALKILDEFSSNSNADACTGVEELDEFIKTSIDKIWLPVWYELKARILALNSRQLIRDTTGLAKEVINRTDLDLPARMLEIRELVYNAERGDLNSGLNISGFIESKNVKSKALNTFITANDKINSQVYNILYLGKRVIRKQVKRPKRPGFLGKKPGNLKDRPVFGLSSLVYFCIPKNNVLSYLRHRADVNLQKIRQGMNISGVRRELNTDSGLFMGQRAGKGKSVQYTKPTPYRFNVLMERSRSMLKTAADLEARLLEFWQKRDTTSYDVFKTRMDIQSAYASTQLQDLKVNEAGILVDIAKGQKLKADIQVEYYDKLIQAGLSSAERELLSEMEKGQLLSEIFGVISYIYSSVASFGTDVSGLTNLVNSTSSYEIQNKSLMATYERREQEWEHQLNLGLQDSNILNLQVDASKVQLDIAEKEKAISQLHYMNAVDTAYFLSTRITLRPELYEWMANIIEDIYQYYIRQAVALARLAEDQLAFERHETGIKFIKGNFGAKGREHDEMTILTGAAQLMQCIDQLDQYAFTTNRRKLQISKTISLARLSPYDFQRFRETGTITFRTLMDMFDSDYPGQYLRLIKRVKTSVIGLIPAVDGIKATLSTVTGISKVIVEADEGFEELFVRRDPEMVVLSSPYNSTGLFDLEIQREQNDMILPFECIGVDTMWEFSMPKPANQFDFGSIADVLVTIEYTALQNNEYKRRVIQGLNRRFNAVRAYSFKHDFTDVWYDLHNTGEDQILEVSFEVGREDFPCNLDGIVIDGITMYFSCEDQTEVEIKVDNLYFFEGGGSSFTGGGANAIEGMIGTERGNAANWIPMIGKAPFGIWKLALGAEIRDAFMRDGIKDIIFVIAYNAQLPEWPG